MKNVNVAIDDERHEDLRLIQEYYSKKSGAKLTQAQTLRVLLFETANLIRNTGETYPGRKDKPEWEG